MKQIVVIFAVLMTLTDLKGQLRLKT